MPNRSRFVMSSINFEVITERKKLGFYAIYQLGVVAKREICSPDAAIKKHIATNDKFLSVVHESHVSGGVSWHKNNVQFRISERNFITFFDKFIRLHGFVTFDSPNIATLLNIAQNWQLFFVHEHFYAVFSLHKRTSKNVVEVPVRLQ